MDYLNHLHTGEFSEPVTFRITGSEEVIFPNRTIEQVLESRLSGDAFDVALTPDSSRAEYAFDAAECSVSEVMAEVRSVLEDFNTPPEDFSNWGEIETEEEWCDRFTVKLADISYDGGSLNDASAELRELIENQS